MGNVPISCCGSKSPRLNRNSSNQSNSANYRKGADGQYSSINNNHHDGKFSHKSANKHGGGGEDYGDGTGPLHILQHISEREPDDSETDPSSNPFNRPIFATRSSNSKNHIKPITSSSINNNNNNNYSDSYSSNNSTTRIRSNTNSNTPLMSSQDHGYNSTTSTNLTHYDGLQLNDSFESSIQRSQVVSGGSSKDNELINKCETKLLLLSPSSSNFDDVYHSSLSVSNRLPTASENDDSRFLKNNLFKASSCSTIYTDGSTISQPNLQQTIKCVSLAVYYHIRNRTSDCSAEIFDESIHPLKMPCPTNTNNNSTELKQQGDELIILESDDNTTTTRELRNDEEPDQKTIYSFVETLFKAAQLTSEYAITTLVYLERLMTYAEMDLTPKTWRRMFLGAILLSSKVWEDQAVWNVDYAQILEEISVEDINELERQFLELIQFNMNVPSSVYAKYYFHLRTLALKNGLNGEQTILTVGKAKTLEAMNRIYTNDWHSSPIHRKSSSKIKRHSSLERTRLNGLAKAVLM